MSHFNGSVVPAGHHQQQPGYYTTGAPGPVPPVVAGPSSAAVAPGDAPLGPPRSNRICGLRKSHLFAIVAVAFIIGAIVGAVVGTLEKDDDDGGGVVAPSASPEPVVETQSMRVEVSTELAGLSADAFENNPEIQDSFKSAVAASMAGQDVSPDDVEITGFEEVQVPVRQRTGRRAQATRTVLRVIFVIIVRVTTAPPADDDTATPPPPLDMAALVAEVTASVQSDTFASDVAFVFVQELSVREVPGVDVTTIQVTVQAVVAAVVVNPTPTPTSSPGATPTPTPSSSRRPLPSRSPSPTPSISATPSRSPTPSISATPSRSPTPSISATPSVSVSATPSAVPSVVASADPLFFLY